MSMIRDRPNSLEAPRLLSSATFKRMSYTTNPKRLRLRAKAVRIVHEGKTVSETEKGPAPFLARADTASIERKLRDRVLLYQ